MCSTTAVAAWDAPIPVGGRDTACTTSRRAPRAAASSNANPSAALESSGSLTPTTISLCTAAVSSRTTTAGQDAWLATYLLTEPSTSAVNPPDPRAAPGD